MSGLNELREMLDKLDRALEAGIICQDRVFEEVLRDSYVGFCLSCGSVQDGVEPDAERYECEACGEREVYGAEELLHSMPLL